MHALYALGAYSLAFGASYLTWLSKVSESLTNWQPVWLTVLLCGAVFLVLGLMDSSRCFHVIAASCIGLLIGFVLFPSSSMKVADRVLTIQNGKLTEFVPFGLCIGSLLGTIVGQNLGSLRRMINRANSSAPESKKDEK